MGCIGLCEGVHTAQRQITTQIPIEFCILVTGLGLGLGLGHYQSDRAIRQVGRELRFKSSSHAQSENPFPLRKGGSAD